MLDEFLNDILFYQKRSIELLRQNKQDRTWQKPDNFTSLSGSDVDIWSARLAPPLMQDLTGILSTYEKKRSQQLRFDRDKLRYVFSRGILRLILSKYLEESPDQIEIVIGPHGKPALSQWEGKYSIHFNLSHSHEWVLYSITRVGEIGVDVEKMREVPDMEKIIGRFFSVRERAAFNDLPPSERKQAFFNCWSRKEALIKAMGGGLSLPLDQFDVSILPNQPAALLDIHWDPLEVHHWLLSEIWLDAYHAAAMAVNISSMGRQSDI
jgi:4'-phosphopantetheinyl transferase